MNPYQSPIEVGGRIPAATPKVSPRLMTAMAWSAGLALACGFALLVGGYWLGSHIYDVNAAYWNKRIYPAFPNGDEPEDKVRIQTALHFAGWLGPTGFWGGLLFPWVRFYWLRFRK
jgi:hypothetical protein